MKSLGWICTELAAVFADTCDDVVVIDYGPKDDLSFAHTVRLSRKKEGPAGTLDSDKKQISASARWNADYLVRTRHIEAVQRGMFRFGPGRRPGFQKSTSPTVGGGLCHEISSHSFRFTSLLFLLCSRRARGTFLGRGSSSPGTTLRYASL